MFMIINYVLRYKCDAFIIFVDCSVESSHWTTSKMRSGVRARPATDLSRHDAIPRSSNLADYDVTDTTASLHEQ